MSNNVQNSGNQSVESDTDREDSSFSINRSVRHSSNQSQADKIVNLMLEREVDLFCDQFQQPCMIRADNPLLAVRLQSQSVRSQLSSSFWNEYGKAAGTESITRAITTLEGLARESKELRDVYNRVAQVGNTVYYDLGDNKHVVVISNDGWEMHTEVPVVFRRLNHQKPQVLPDKDGSINTILEFLNLTDDIQETLLTTYLPVSLLANIPRPIILLHGPQGSGKSTALELLRSLLDPSQTPLLTLPNDKNEIVQQADHHFCYYLDNISHFNHDTSDLLCRLVTGGAFSKRVLYTVDDDFLYKFKKAIALNGVTQFANHPDLLDRTIILQLNRIDESTREHEESLWTRFNEAKPKMLGGLFNALSATLSIAPELELSRLPRMADYYRYACGVARYLGITQEKFDEANNRNIEQQNQEALEVSPIAQTIIYFMYNKMDWSGSSSKLYDHLQEIAVYLNVSKNFPKSSIWLWRNIQTAQTSLNAVGITASHGRNDSYRTIALVKDRNHKNAVNTDYADIGDMKPFEKSQLPFVRVNPDTHVAEVMKEEVVTKDPLSD